MAKRKSPRPARSASPTGFSAAQIDAAVAARDAASFQTPDIVLEAFLPEKIAAGELPFQPVTMARMMQLQLAAPGILKKGNPDDFDLKEIAAAMFIMSQDEDLSEDLLGTRALDPLSGKVIFPRFAKAVFALAKKIPAAALVLIGQAIDQSLVAATKPAIPFGIDKTTDAESPFPQAPTPDRGSAGS